MNSTPKAMIIEDEADLAFAFSTALESAGYEVEVFYNGREALARLAEITPYLVVTDLHLPEISGDDIIAYIRDTERLKDIFVMVASADGSFAKYSRAKEANIELLKPVGFTQLRILAERFHPDKKI